MADVATRKTRKPRKYSPETPTMKLAAELIWQSDSNFDSLTTYLAWARREENPDGTPWTWDDIAFDVRQRTDGQVRAVRETVRTWAERLGLLPPEKKRASKPAVEA